MNCTVTMGPTQGGPTGTPVGETGTASNKVAGGVPCFGTCLSHGSRHPPTTTTTTGLTERFTGRVNRHFEPADKVGYAQELCARLGAGLDQVVAVGDGFTDIPLFEAVGFSVALNATDAARSVAPVAVDSESFPDAINAVPDLWPQDRG